MPVHLLLLVQDSNGHVQPGGNSFTTFTIFKQVFQAQPLIHTAFTLHTHVTICICMPTLPSVNILPSSNTSSPQ